MRVSIVIIAKNEEGFIKSLLQGLFDQSYQDFEIIIIDNGSIDGTRGQIKLFPDKRIKYFCEKSRCGLAELRNLGVQKTSGIYIFFIDGDCIPTKYWLEEGLKVLETGKFLGVEGKTYYESQQEVTVSDYNTHQVVAGKFMSCNVVYTRDILNKVNYFDPKFRYGHEDRDLAYRILKHGKIFFSSDMLVIHQKKRLTIKALFNRMRWAENAVDFIKKHGSFPGLKGNVLYPKRLLIIFCPFILIFTVSYRTFYDLIIGFFKYIFYIYERIIIWKAAIKNRIFII